MAHQMAPLSGGGTLAVVVVVLGFVSELVSLGAQIDARGDEPKAPIVAAKRGDGEKPPQTRVSGFVRDEAGQPVAGATVVLEGVKHDDKPLILQTGADGRFAFPAIADDPHRYYVLEVLAGKEGFAPAFGGAEPGQEPRVELTLTRPGTFTGSVRDPEGRPVVGARVQFGTLEGRRLRSWIFAAKQALRGTPLEPFFIVRTDATGLFRFTTVPVNKSLGFRVEAEGMADLCTTQRIPAPEYIAGPASPPLALEMVREGRINGRVVSHIPGMSVGGLHVWLNGVGKHLPAIQQTRTDAGGRFALRGLPECTVSVQFYGQANDWVAKAAPTVTLKPGTVTEVTLELIEGVMVEGKVVTADRSEPVAGVSVGAHGPAHPRGAGASNLGVTDEEGRYRIRLPPGETELFVRYVPKGFARPADEEPAARVSIPDGVKTFAGPTLTVKRATAP